MNLRTDPLLFEICLRSFREVSVEGGASVAFTSNRTSVERSVLIREIISSGKTGFAASSENRFIKLHTLWGMLLSASTCSSLVVTCRRS